ncbi:hypothetical protein CDO52_01975 [Nocardiopsis gilva YIM 90087]|uniref:HTH merR-type domain-containing protein n=2 Tax=Nocardiopsis gilva TaxID=280236 RepID=A0A223SCX9_9ACTN|nr:hypothetical protein CDO52_01975 [Nocardiopsis gilva YIM 90087]
MNIGEFARLTGLSAKALRLYDERGLLCPASVDACSGYRRYAAGQLPTAMRLRALRNAGIPLAEAGLFLADADTSREALAAHRAALAAERARTDAALAALEEIAVNPGGRPSWRVEERREPTQPWAGIVLELHDDERGGDQQSEEDDIKRYNEAFAALGAALSDGGIATSDPFWSSFREIDGSDRLELLCCWPLAGPLPEGWSMPGWTLETGELPPRTELVVRWRHDDAAPEVEGAAHPAVISLILEAERRGDDLDFSRLRQIGLMEDGEAVGVEVAIPTL